MVEEGFVRLKADYERRGQAWPVEPSAALARLKSLDGHTAATYSVESACEATGVHEDFIILDSKSPQYKEALLRAVDDGEVDSFIKKTTERWLNAEKDIRAVLSNYYCEEIARRGGDVSSDHS
jgi:hypothetical protein